MNLEFIEQILQNRIASLELIKNNAFRSGDLESYNNADLDQKETQITSNKLGKIK